MRLIRNIRQQVEIPVSIHYNEARDALEVVIGEWVWEGPLQDLPTARERRARVRADLRKRFNEGVSADSKLSPSDTYGLAIQQALRGETIKHPEYF